MSFEKQDSLDALLDGLFDTLVEPLPPDVNAMCEAIFGIEEPSVQAPTEEVDWNEMLTALIALEKEANAIPSPQAPPQAPLDLVKSRDGVWHTPVSTVQRFLDHPDEFTEAEVASFRNGVFDESLKGHSIARQSLLIQKAMFIAHTATGMSMSELTMLTGSLEMYKCQGFVENTKTGERTQCDATAVSGFFFCGNHRHCYTHEEGCAMYQRRRKGERPEEDVDVCQISMVDKPVRVRPMHRIKRQKRC